MSSSLCMTEDLYTLNDSFSAAEHAQLSCATCPQQRTHATPSAHHKAHMSYRCTLRCGILGNVTNQLVSIRNKAQKTADACLPKLVQELGPRPILRPCLTSPAQYTTATTTELGLATSDCPFKSPLSSSQTRLIGHTPQTRKEPGSQTQMGYQTATCPTIHPARTYGIAC